MTDADWRNGRTRDDLLAMISAIQSRTWSEGSGRRFGVACMRRVWDLLTDPRFRDLVEALEGWIAGTGSEAEFAAARLRLPAIANWRPPAPSHRATPW